MGKTLGVRDVPIGAGGDLLKLDRYARSLAQFILRCETPITVGIQGDWGSGKSSLMNLVRSLLDEQGSISTLELNTWQNAQVESGAGLPILLLEELSKSIIGGHEPTPEQGRLSKALKGLGRWKALGVSFAGTGVQVEREGQAPPEVPDIRRLRQGFEEAIETRIRRDESERLVMFIDDLDRIRPERAVEILEVLKNFVDVPNAVFVIACDYQVVVKGLRAKFGVSEGDLGGRSFFDKIIQVPFRMPVHQYDVDNFLKQMLKGIDWSFGRGDIPAYRRFLELSVGFNPRSVKRLCNSLLLLALVAREEKLGKRLRDPHTALILFAVVCLESKYEAVHAELSARAEDPEDLEVLLGIRSDADEESRLSPRTLSKLGDDRSREQVQAFLNTLGGVVDADSDGSIDGDEHASLLQMVTLSAVTTVGQSSAPEARRWTEEDLRAVFKGNEPVLALLDFAKKHSDGGRVTQKAKTQKALVKFYVRGVRNGREVVRLLFNCSSGHLVLHLHSMPVAQTAHDTFRQRLGAIFGSDIDVGLKSPHVRTRALTVARVRALEATVLELVGAVAQDAEV